MQPLILSLALGTSLLLGTACGEKDGGDSGTTDGSTDGSTDGGTDGSTDGGTDGGTDSGTSDGGTDGGGSVDVDCDADYGADAPGGPACVTDSMSCGDSVLATTAGGSTVFDGDAYVSWYCEVVSDDEYQGPERVYEWVHPGTGDATLTLDTPCEDLDIFVIRWDDDTCPVADYNISECEGKKGTGTHEVTIWNNEPSRYLVSVEGSYGEEANFGLSIACD